MADNKLNRCPITGARDLEPLYGYERHHLVRSRSSGFVVCSVVPTPDELEAAYGRYQREAPPPPLTVRRFSELLDTVAPFRKTGDILDIGCGSGYFLEVAVRKGWKASGTEFSGVAIELCRTKGIVVYPGGTDTRRIGRGRFDVVTCMEVLEHLIDPLTEARKAFELLRPGGVFYFTTPNFDALERYILRDRYNIICYPEHLGYFTRKTVDLLLCKVGFTPLALYTQGFSLTRVVGSLRSRGTLPGEGIPLPGEEERDATNRERAIDEGIRAAIEGVWALETGKGILNAMLNAFGAGCSLRGLYQKPSDI